MEIFSNQFNSTIAQICAVCFRLDRVIAPNDYFPFGKNLREDAALPLWLSSPMSSLEQFLGRIQLQKSTVDL